METGTLWATPNAAPAQFPSGLPELTILSPGEPGLRHQVLAVPQIQVFEPWHHDILDWIVLCLWRCPVHCRTISNMSDLHPLDLSSTASPARVVTARSVSRHSRVSPGGEQPLAENPGSKWSPKAPFPSASPRPHSPSLGRPSGCSQLTLISL
uniref:Uncharacterized protein n=1 Tax=Myotis myotis TaxID=51298 RepID=A0A7J7WWM0_MYOMY|nr:hypothetical protein mMyoMyo1_011981 [Myotis myotis]